jgi:hypothetical protein
LRVWLQLMSVAVCWPFTEGSQAPVAGVSAGRLLLADPARCCFKASFTVDTF